MGGPRQKQEKETREIVHRVIVRVCMLTCELNLFVTTQALGIFPTVHVHVSVHP